MKEVFIVSKNTDLPNYLFLLLKGIEREISLTLAPEYTKKHDLVIVDTETVSAEEVEMYQNTAPVLLFAYTTKPLLIQYTSKYDINGILSLDMEAEDIRKTLSAALEGDIFYSDGMISLLFSNKINQLSERVSSLTEREVEILKLMMKDLTNEEIADELKLSVRTVNAHKGNIMRKIEAKTTSGLIRILSDYSTIFKNLS
ncbi:MAG: hypothetical protein Tsb0034_07740 [Ekhidna sp.]